MTVTIPEEIVPSVFSAFTPDDFIDIAPGVLPNGEDAMVYTGAAGCQELRFSQPRRLDSHLLNQSPVANSLSFWIRRKQNWNNTFGDPGNSSAGNTSTVPAQLIMGLGSPLGNSLDDAANFLGWALCAVGVSQINFGIRFRQSATPGYIWSGSAILTLNTWHLITLTISPWTDNDASVLRPVMSLYRDGVLQATNQPNSTVYPLVPYQITNFDLAEMAFGCPVNVAAAVVGAAASPILDIGKVCFHDRVLTAADQFDLYKSMYYGGT